MVELPFGTTAVNRETIGAHIDGESFKRLLREAGVNEPAMQLEEFLSVVPDLMRWLELHGREYPWRYTTDPWRVYITEILLQRTRGDAVAGVYDEFFDQYPAPRALYDASDEEIKSIIESLGFGNQRTRTLNECTEMIIEKCRGQVPNDLDLLKQPWRVGDYSARATRLFAFNEPEPLVDANIARLVERVFAYPMPEQPHKDSAVYDLMAALTPTDPGIARALYFSFLDLGAQVCTSESPACKSCPLSVQCLYWLSKEED